MIHERATASGRDASFESSKAAHGKLVNNIEGRESQTSQEMRSTAKGYPEDLSWKRKKMAKP